MMKTDSLSDVDQKAIVRKYKEGKTLAELARMYDRCPRTMRRVLQRHRVGLRKESYSGWRAGKDYMPTPEQIEEAKLEVQNSWSEKERQDREVQKTEPVTTQNVDDGDRHRKPRASTVDQ